ncbi:MAG: SIMPL domain-containing protein [Patescibacteria group bacterium]|nr:SIMPL domain-containing protein [Patescibacteria group bacterium]MCL5432117.1 SIMPL domain-containing protein [Patescibacteria group bacterium]
MKSFVGAILLFFIFLFFYSRFGPGFPLSVNQITTTKNDLFTVTGEGKVTAAPDTAQVNLGFTASAANVTDVQNQANQIIKKISDDIKKLGIGESDIQTTAYSLQPNYSPNQRITGYSATVNLTVKVRDFNKINQIIDTATADGANQVGGLAFTLDDATQTKLQSQARKIAIDQAKAKAAEIAADAGISLGRIVGVSENQPNPIRPLYAAGAIKTDAATPPVPTQIEPGSAEITIDVTLSYETR